MFLPALGAETLILNRVAGAACAEKSVHSQLLSPPETMGPW